MKKYLITGLIFTGILILFFWHQSFYLSWHLKPLGITMDVPGYKVENYDELIFKERKNFEILSRKEANIIRFKIIKDIDRETAQKYIDNVFYSLENYFGPQEILALYADLVEAVANSPESLKPKRETVIINGKETPCFIVFADKYFSYFLMTENQAFYRGILTMIYCPKEKNLVNIEILVPKEKFNFEKIVETLKTFKCR